MSEIITEDTYFIALESILDKIADKSNNEEYKHICDKLNNSWIDGLTVDGWIESADIDEYLE